MRSILKSLFLLGPKGGFLLATRNVAAVKFGLHQLSKQTRRVGQTDNQAGDEPDNEKSAVLQSNQHDQALRLDIRTSN